MKFTTLFSWAILMPMLNLFGQKTGSVTGILLGAETREPLIGAAVFEKQTKTGTATNENGQFLLENLPEGNCQIIISYLGFEDKILENIAIKHGETLDLGYVELIEKQLTLKEITVTPGSFSVMGGAPVSRLTLTERDIKTMSWAEDITRAVTRLPGVASTEFSSKFTVRGGEDNEVLMVLDGMELYEPFHQRDFVGGLFSIVDIETIQGINLLTGGFGAEFGQRQSGVFQMKTKHIQDDQQHTSVGLNVMNARVYTDGNFSKNKGKFLFSARRSTIDLLFKAVGFDETVPTYYDGMAKMEYSLNPKQVISFHLLHAGDKLAVRDIKPDNFDRHDTRYYNSYGWLTLQSSFSQDVFARTLLYGGSISHKREGLFHKRDFADKGDFELLDKRKYNFFGLKQDWTWDASKRFALKAGFDVRQLHADYDYVYSIREIRVTNTDSLYIFSNAFDIKTKPTGQLANVYASGRFMLLPKLFLEAGGRFDLATYTDDKVFSPRVSLAYAFSKNSFLRAAWGKYFQSQFINNLDVNHNGTRFDPAELSTHYVLGFEHLFRNGISMRLETYYKDIERISPIYRNLRDPWEAYPESRNDVVKLDLASARAAGIELFLKYDTGKKLSYWFSYALAKAEENISDIEFDGIFNERTGWQLRPFNQLHTVYVDVNYRPTPKWTFNLSWALYKGWPLTTYEYAWKHLPADNPLAQETSAAFPSADGTLHFYQVHKDYNGTPYPAYHRMDLRVNRFWKAGKSGRISAFLHVINLYNRFNLRKFDLGVTGEDELPISDGKGGYVITQDNTSWFGITPVLGASWEF